MDVVDWDRWEALMTRVPDYPKAEARLEETPFGLEMVVNKALKGPEAERFLAELDKRAAEINARQAQASAPHDDDAPQATPQSPPSTQS